jgi:plasmid stabilization system protein ParE
MPDDAAPHQPIERLGDLFDGREEWAPRSPDDKIAALADGLLVIDTNVLLNLYRYGAEARGELIQVLQLVGDRLFVPGQVAAEFLRNRVPVAMDVRRELDKGAESAAKSLRRLGEELKALGRNRGLGTQQQETLTRTLSRTEKSVRRLLGPVLSIT